LRPARRRNKIADAMRLRRLILFFAVSIGVAIAQNPRRTPDVPYVPSTEEAVNGMLKLADVASNDVVYDLGCGDGRIVIAAAKAYGAHGVGIDIDPVRIAEAKANAKNAGVEKLVRFEENDLFQADVHEASVVTLFLLSSVNRRLEPKLRRELNPGTRIVSNTFRMADWQADKEFTVGGTAGDFEFSKHLYLWIVPLRK
jgi:SAM-dependent methyltransferase